ncbi:MAG: exo-alpha-sialidase [Vicinamibacterales bacterium]
MNANSRPVLLSSFVAVAVLAVAAGYLLQAKAESVPVSDLHAQTHIHGLAVGRRDPGTLLIATHHGLFRSGPDGEAELVSEVQDFMGFNADPVDPERLYASGHPAGGGNLGFIVSTDRGKTWEQVSPGLSGPVDFHQMTVSPADPRVIYGAYGALQVSRDAGKTWSVAGPLPDRLIDLAASAGDARKLFAATEGGLMVTRDSGATWEAIFASAPVSMVEVAPDGRVYAFVLGRGLIGSADDPLDFEIVSGDWGERFLLHLAIDPSNPDRLFGATQDGAILASADGGKTWKTFGE